MKLLVAFLLLAGTAAAQQWTRVNVPTTAGLRGLSVVRDTAVWASGTDGTVLRSIDGGRAWSVMNVPGADKLDFRGIHAFDDQTAVIISSGPAEKGQARIYRTSDGGRNWTQVFEQKRAGIFLDAIAFWDRRHGIVLSDPVDGRFALFITDDGGSTWKQIPPATLPPALPNEGAFAASNSCLAVEGKSNVWFASGGATVARVFRSSDRGKSWTASETPLHPKNASSGIFSLAFADANNGVAAGGDYQHPERSKLPNVLRTRDGGKSWEALASTDPAGVYFSSVVLAGKRIVAAGSGGGWTNSRDWKHESSDNLNAVAVWRDTLWAVGPKGVVLKSSIAEEDGSEHGRKKRPPRRRGDAEKTGKKTQSGRDNADQREIRSQISESVFISGNLRQMILSFLTSSSPRLRGELALFGA